MTVSRFESFSGRHRGGMALAALVCAGWAGFPAQAQAQDARFVLRDGQEVCGGLLTERGATTTLQLANGHQVALRNDQILDRTGEPCATLAVLPATAISGGFQLAQATPPPAARPAAPAAPAQRPATPAAPAAGAPGAAPGSQAWQELRILGSDAIAVRLLPDLVDAYIGRLNMRPRGWAAGTVADQRIQDALGTAGQVPLRFSVTATVTGLAFPALAERRSDIGLAARAPNAREIELVRAGIGVDLRNVEHVLALDGLAAVTHVANPVRRITMDQLRDIFAGTITNWSAVGGPDRPIVLYAREPDAAAMQVFGAEVMQRRAVAASTQRITNWTDLSNTVADDPDGIAVLTMSFVGRGRALNLVASCGIEFEASEFALRTQDYPLERRFTMYVSPNAPGATEDFIEYALSPAAYEVVREAGYSSMQPTVGSRDYTQFRLLDATRAAPNSPDPRYMEAMGDYSVMVRSSVRLSTTFRFEAGSYQPDRRGMRDLERVAIFLRSPEGQRFRVNVLGFTDSVGAFGVNRSLSMRRAGSIADLLRQRGVTVHQLRGYASVAPVTCDDDPNAALKNRRVEIWLTPT